MPSDKRSGGRRTAIVNWRVKAGKREVFSNAQKIKCEEYIREHGGKLDGVKLRLVQPNKQGHRGH